MASRYFVAGGVDSNWSTSGNWSASSGGAGGETVPTASDAVFFDASSPSCTLDAPTAKVAASLTCTGYTGTLTFNAQLTVSGNVTLGAGMAFAGSSLFEIAPSVATTATVTTNGVTITVPLTLRPQHASSGMTLADNLNVDAALTMTSGHPTYAPPFNGATIFAGGDLTIGTGGGISHVAGTATLVLDGTGTWSEASVDLSQDGLNLNTTINTAGTITVSGTVRYRTGTLTYTAGTVVTTGSTLTVTGPATLNTNGVTWNHVTLRGQATTITLTSAVAVSGTLTLNTAGNAGFTVNGSTITVSGDLTVTHTSIYSNTPVLGTTAVVLNGTGTWSHTSSTPPILRLPLSINTAGTVTVSGTVRYDTGTLTYTAGTVVTTGSTLLISSNATLATAGVTWNHVTVSGTATLTLTSLLTIAGTFTWSAAVTCAGAAGWTAATLVCTTAGLTHTLVAATTYTVTTALTLVGTSASHLAVRSSSTPTKAVLTLQAGASQVVEYANATDIDSSAGDAITTGGGVLSNTTNWLMGADPVTGSDSVRLVGTDAVLMAATMAPADAGVVAATESEAVRLGAVAVDAASAGATDTTASRVGVVGDDAPRVVAGEGVTCAATLALSESMRALLADSAALHATRETTEAPALGVSEAEAVLRGLVETDALRVVLSDVSATTQVLSPAPTADRIRGTGWAAVRGTGWTSVRGTGWAAVTRGESDG